MNLADALKNLTEEEAMAVFQALDQYVENGQCNDSVEDPYEDEHLKPAEAVLERLGAALASLAQDDEEPSS